MVGGDEFGIDEDGARERAHTDLVGVFVVCVGRGGVDLFVVVAAGHVAEKERQEDKQGIEEIRFGSISEGLPAFLGGSGEIVCVGGFVGERFGVFGGDGAVEEDLCGNVVISAVVVGRFYECFDGFLCGFGGCKDVLNVFIFDFSVESVGGEEDTIPFKQFPRRGHDFDIEGKFATKDTGQYVLAGVIFGFFFGEDACFDKALNGAVIAGHAVELTFSPQVHAAIADVSGKEVAILHHAHDTGCSHACEGMVFTGFFEDGACGLFDGFAQSDIGFHVGFVLEVRNDLLDSDPRSDLSTACAPHAVRDDQEVSALVRDLGELESGDGVLVFVTTSADVGHLGDINGGGLYFTHPWPLSSKERGGSGSGVSWTVCVVESGLRATVKR